LRKLDAGVLSAVEFQDIIFTMGIELPEGVLKQLQLQAQSGLLDWRACVQALDGYVFKYRSLTDDAPRESVSLAKDKLVQILNSSVSPLPLPAFTPELLGISGLPHEAPAAVQSSG
jgi:hypothetical protein